MAAVNLVPVTLTEARRFVANHHRHNRPPQGWLFGVGLKNAIRDQVIEDVSEADRQSEDAIDAEAIGNIVYEVLRAALATPAPEPGA